MSEFKQIKASAGSGKTYTLTSRFLSLLASSSAASWERASSGCALSQEGPYGWQEILAITFTNKAAAEMRERLFLRLKAMALSPSSSPARKDGWTPARARHAVTMLIRSYSALNIRTIDSLLHLMVRLSALDFDLSPDFEPRFSDADIIGPLFDELAEAARNDAAAGDIFRASCRQMLYSEKNRGFLAGEGVKEKVSKIVSLMLAGEGWNIRDLASSHEAERHFQSILHEIENDAREMLSRLEREALKANRFFINALNSCASCQGQAGSLPFSSAMLKKESFDDCLLKASRGQASMALHALYHSLQNDMKELHILLGARRFMPFVELAQHVYASLEAYELKNGIVASSQIPRLARSAADGGEGVSELLCRFGTRITHILIDEFQDTSLDQWLALQPLAIEALSRNGSLTIVGDVKQAIYGWRGGDARLFDQLVSSGSELLPLVDSPLLETLPFNWRSRRSIVSWNNALFSALASPDTARDILFPLAENDEELLQEEAALLAGAFQGASQSAEHCPEGGSVCLYPLEKGHEDDIASLLPDMVETMGKSRPWGGICILVRNNEQAAKTASWLMARHIPVVTQGSLLLAEQPVIAGLIHLLRFINSPEDDIAFFSLLSSEELLPPLPSSSERPSWNDWLAARSEDKSLARQFAADFPEEWSMLFSSLHDAASLLTPYDTVMEVLKRWHVAERRPAEEGFIRRFLEVLFCAEEQGISDLPGFLEFWDANGRQEKAPLPESMNAVSIMTMHKAKGLEFDTVILPFLNFPLGRNTDEKAVFWKSRGIGLLAPLCKDMGRPWLKDRMDTARESMHLIYVAMTRAVSELHCFLPSAEEGPMAAMIHALVSRMGKALKNKNGVLFWGEENTAPRHSENISPSSPMPCLDAAPPRSPAPAFMEEDNEENWRPMSWLPRLRIFRTPLEDWTFTPKRRGTLVHHCLEYLQISAPGQKAAKSDAALAASRGIATFPLPVPDREKMQSDIEDMLFWYATQPETPHWLAFGTPEHSLMDSKGRQYRVDLLVDDGRELVAVEYKTGTRGNLPSPAHKAQLFLYLSLLEEATGKKARGALVYLDRHSIFSLSSGERHE